LELEGNRIHLERLLDSNLQLLVVIATKAFAATSEHTFAATKASANRSSVIILE
jgi:hypothetical protein